MNQPILYCELNTRDRTAKAGPIKKGQISSLSPQKIGNGGAGSTGSEEENFKVFVRIRPLNQREIAMSNGKKRTKILKKQEDMVFVLDPDGAGDSKKEKGFVFSDVFDENDNNKRVFAKSIHPLLGNLFQGYNVTVFAYGMTSAGKSFTMFGNDMFEEESNEKLTGQYQRGIVFQALESLFSAISTQERQEFVIKLSYLEIYNEHVRDLLVEKSENLMILEDQEKGMVVSGLTEYVIKELSDVYELVTEGNSRRQMAATGANQFSSRSHAIVQISMEMRKMAKDLVDEVIYSKLSLIDLAGSERACVTDNKGARMIEGANINRSLLALGNCINILSDPNKKDAAFVPFRDSKLTRLLKDSLGGNTKSAMIACVSPSIGCFEETTNTLKYASKAKNIKRKVVKNIKEVQAHVSEYKGIIDSLKEEIEFLKAKLQEKERIPSDKDEILDANTLKKEKFVRESVEGIGPRLFENLEENWEITQTLNELNELREQNEEHLSSLMDHLADIINDEEKKEDEFHIKEEIKALNIIMENNDKVKKELERNLQKNLSEKCKLHEAMKRMTINYQDIGVLQEVCQTLKMEKDQLYSQNIEMKREALNLAKEKEEKNNRINEIERELERVKKELNQKNKIIEESDKLLKQYGLGSSMKNDINSDSESSSSLEDCIKKENLAIKLEANGFSEQSKTELQAHTQSKNQFYFKIPEKFLNTPGSKAKLCEAQSKNPWDAYQERAITTNKNEQLQKAPENSKNPKEIHLKITKVEHLNSEELKEQPKLKIKERKLSENNSLGEFKKYAEDIQHLDFSKMKQKSRKKNIEIEIKDGMNTLPPHAALLISSENNELANSIGINIDPGKVEIEEIIEIKRKAWEVNKQLEKNGQKTVFQTFDGTEREELEHPLKSQAKNRDLAGPLPVNQIPSNIQRHIGALKSQSQLNLGNISNNASNGITTKNLNLIEKQVKYHNKNNSTTFSPSINASQRTHATGSFLGSNMPFSIYTTSEMTSSIPISREEIGSNNHQLKENVIDTNYEMKEKINSGSMQKADSLNFQDLSSIVNMPNQEQPDGVEEELIRHIDACDKKGKFKRIYSGKNGQEEDKVLKIDLYKMKTPIKTTGGGHSNTAMNNPNFCNKGRCSPGANITNNGQLKKVQNYVEQTDSRKNQSAKSNVRDKQGDERKLELQNLDEAREKLRKFKQQLSKVTLGLSQGFNENLRSEILTLLQDFIKNKYAISTSDRQILIKLESLLLARHSPPANDDFKMIGSQRLEDKSQDLIHNKSSSQASKIINDENIQRHLSLHSRIQPGIFSDVNINYANHVNKALESDVRRTRSKSPLPLKDHSGTSNALWRTPNKDINNGKDPKPSKVVKELIKRQKEMHQPDFRNLTPRSLTKIVDSGYEEMTNEDSF